MGPQPPGGTRSGSIELPSRYPSLLVPPSSAPDDAPVSEVPHAAGILYARSEGVHIAYAVLGRGPIDLVYVPGWISHIECAWEEPDFARYYERLASFSRLILFDKRGTGLSDRDVASLPTLEQRMDDVRAVMDAAGSKRAAVMGISEGGVMSALFAATYPERTSALVLYGTYARRIWAPDYPWAPTPEVRQKYFDAIERSWGKAELELDTYAPTRSGDERFRRWWGRYRRMSVSPGTALALAHMNTQADIRHVLPSIRVPTLVLHRTGDRDMNVAEGRYIAARIPGAKFVELPGEDHLPYLGDTDGLVDEVEEFLTGARHGPEPDRVLATILFTDIVASTEHAASAGDRRWRAILESYHTIARGEIERRRGRLLDTAGDGVLAAFDGPARAVRCACAIGDGARTLGLEVRAGLHTGECETVHAKLGGIAVHIGARVAAAAGPGEVLVSSTVKDLVAGSGLRFTDRGTRVLAGVPGEWHLFAADPGSARLD